MPEIALSVNGGLCPDELLTNEPRYWPPGFRLLNEEQKTAACFHAAVRDKSRAGFGLFGSELLRGSERAALPDFADSVLVQTKHLMQDHIGVLAQKR